MVSVSRNISINRPHKDLYISLCRQIDYKLKYSGEFYACLDVVDTSTAYGRMKLGCPIPEDLAIRDIYIIIQRAIPKDKPVKYIHTLEAAPEIKNVINRLDEFMPGAFKVGYVESTNVKPKDALTRLVESGFDLSILP